MSESKKLPDKMSALLRVAVNDAQLCEADSRYRLNMRAWHSTVRQGDSRVCHVCLAGSVMAQSLSSDPEHDLGPSDFHDEDALHALDDMRLGMFLSAAQELSIAPTADQRAAFASAEGLVENSMDRDLGRAPWPVYLEAAGILEKAGL